jgi:hypothetical protein
MSKRGVTSRRMNITTVLDLAEIKDAFTRGCASGFAPNEVTGTKELAKKDGAFDVIEAETAIKLHGRDYVLTLRRK